MKERFEYIDYLESVSIFFVVLYHGTQISIFDIINGGLIENIIYFFRGILSIAVPTFFVCNGFLLLNRNLDIRKHYIKTAKLFLITIVWQVATLNFALIIDGVHIKLKDMTILSRLFIKVIDFYHTFGIWGLFCVFIWFFRL